MLSLVQVARTHVGRHIRARVAVAVFRPSRPCTCLGIVLLVGSTSALGFASSVFTMRDQACFRNLRGGSSVGLGRFYVQI